MSSISEKNHIFTLIPIGIYSALISINIFMAAPLFDLIKEEFKILDIQVSLVSSLFYISLGAFSIIWAYIIDKNRWSRKKSLIFLTLIASATSFLASKTSNIIQLVISYTLTGVFLGGSFSLIFGILADRYPLKFRLSIFAIWNLMYGIGSSAGYFLSIMIGEGFGWRNVFLTSSFLIALSSIMLVFVKEPKIGESEEILKTLFDQNLNYSFKVQLENLKNALRKATNRNLFLQYFALSVGWGSFTSWMIYLIMSETGLSKTNTSIILGLIVVFGAFHVYVAQYVQKKQGNKLHKKLVYGTVFSIVEGTSYILLTLVVSVKLKPIEGPFLYQISETLKLLLGYPSLFIIIILSGIGSMLGSTTKPIDTATISEINLPEEKAAIVGYLYISELIGKGLGVFLTGTISTITGSLRLGLIICLFSYYIGAMFWYFASKSYNRDRELQQKILLNRVNEIINKI